MRFRNLYLTTCVAEMTFAWEIKSCFGVELAYVILIVCLRAF